VQFGKEIPTFRRKPAASSTQKMEAPDFSENFISNYKTIAITEEPNLTTQCKFLPTAEFVHEQNKKL
jgi:hypothetical protein